MAYADHVRQILSEDDFVAVCGGHSNLSAEAIGDIFEFWLGMFYIASIFPDILEDQTWVPSRVGRKFLPVCSIKQRIENCEFEDQKQG